MTFSFVETLAYPNNPVQQLEFLQQSAAEDRSRRASQVIAHVIRRRWERKPELILQEFYELQLWPTGSQIVEELAEVGAVPRRDRDTESTNHHFITLLAQQALNLSRLSGEAA